MSIALLTACLESPTAPKDDPCPAMFNCSGGPGPSPDTDIPPYSAVFEAASRSRDKLRAEVESGAIRFHKRVDWDNMVFLGRTKYLACPFYVSNPDSDPNGSSGQPGCASGKYSPHDDQITVTTFYGMQDTLALIEWETRNRFLVLGGRSDLAH